MLIDPKCAASSWSTEWHCIACCSFFPHTQYTLGFRDGGCVNFERSHMCAFILINSLLSTRWHCIACCNIFLHTQYTLGFWDGECANIDRSQLSSFLLIHTFLSTALIVAASPHSYCIHIPQWGLAHLRDLSWVRGLGGIGFRVSRAMQSEVPMAASLTTQEILQHTDPPAFQIQQVDILIGLRENIQTPPPGEFRMEDLVWTDHVTHGKGRHKGSRMTFILWDRLEDLISGEQNNTLYPCKVNAEVSRRNLPNSLRSPRAYSPALVVWSYLLHFLLPRSLLLMGFSNGALSNNSTCYARCPPLSVVCPS